MDINEYVKQLETLVNIDSGSHNPEGVSKVADHLSSWYSDIGWIVKRHHIADEVGPLLEIVNCEAEHYDVMFIGHMDTVFPDGTVQKRPFTRNEDLCYGPGVEDMKNGDLAMLHIAKNLPEDVNRSLNICMVHNPDEEISSKYSKKLLKEIGRKCSRIFVMESSQNNGSGHVFQRKGKSNFTIDFYGIAAHAGYIFEHENASAIEEMGHFICEVAKLKDEEKQTSVNIGIANAGNVVNQVADYARIEFEARYNSIDEKKRIYESVNALAKKPFVKGCKTVISNYYETDPWVQSEEGWEYIRRVKKIAEDMGMKFEERKRGGLSDANHLAEVCPIIMDGMGPFGSNAHSEKEYMSLSSVEPCIRLFLAILEDLKNGSH